MYTYIWQSARRRQLETHRGVWGECGRQACADHGRPLSGVCLTCMPYTCALYVCLICVPYMYALYVRLICMPYIHVWCVCLTWKHVLIMDDLWTTSYVCEMCMPYMCVWCVCLICMPYMYAWYVCLICMPYMYALYVCCICMPYKSACALHGRPLSGVRLVRVPYMHAWCVCMICMRDANVWYVCLMCTSCVYARMCMPYVYALHSLSARHRWPFSVRYVHALYVC